MSTPWTSRRTRRACWPSTRRTTGWRCSNPPARGPCTCTTSPSVSTRSPCACGATTARRGSSTTCRTRSASSTCGRRNVVATLKTADEPCDVVFAGTPERAFVSCSQVNKIQVFDPADLAAPPRRRSTSRARTRARWRCRRTGLEGVRGRVRVRQLLDHPGRRTDHPRSPACPTWSTTRSGPYGGQNPPPNASGTVFNPPFDPRPCRGPLRVGLIVKKDATGKWLDDNGTDWTAMVSGQPWPPLVGPPGRLGPGRQRRGDRRHEHARESPTSAT